MPVGELYLHARELLEQRRADDQALEEALEDIRSTGKGARR